MRCEVRHYFTLEASEYEQLRSENSYIEEQNTLKTLSQVEVKRLHQYRPVLKIFNTEKEIRTQIDIATGYIERLQQQNLLPLPFKEQ
jgi:hypothetical protein